MKGDTLEWDTNVHVNLLQMSEVWPDNIPVDLTHCPHGLHPSICTTQQDHSEVQRKHYLKKKKKVSNDNCSIHSVHIFKCCNVSSLLSSLSSSSSSVITSLTHQTSTHKDAGRKHANIKKKKKTLVYLNFHFLLLCTVKEVTFFLANFRQCSRHM